MIPESVVLLTQVLELRQTLVDDRSLVALEIVLAHLLKCLLEGVQEVLDAALEIPTVLLTLDQDAVTGPCVMEGCA